jgi:ATP-binding cassette subfamily F protein 3
MSETEGRNYLAQYLFRGDDVFKPVSALSGGERGRLALALLALNGANFLLLDEPTNHLDIPSQEVLQSVLEQFDGTIILVSHDRYLVDRLATQIWEIRDGHLHPFIGTYQEFLADREGGIAPVRTVSSKVQLPAENKEAAPVDLDWVADLAPPPPPQSRKERRRAGRRVRELSEQIEETEAWLVQLDFDAAAEQSAEQATRIHAEKETAMAELARLNQELDEIMEGSS